MVYFYVSREGDGASHELQWCKEKLAFYPQCPLLHKATLTFLFANVEGEEVHLQVYTLPPS